MQGISAAWLAGKQVREKGFSLGRFSPEYLAHFRIAVVRFEGRAVAFANLLECQTRAVASLDLMRVLPDAPKSTMEFLMLGLIQQFQGEGYARFSLGMVPLAGLQTRKGAPLPLRLGALVFDRGESFYNFQAAPLQGQVPAAVGTALSGRAGRARPLGGIGRHRRVDRRRSGWTGEALR